jgi:hypothetical protein
MRDSSVKAERTAAAVVVPVGDGYGLPQYPREYGGKKSTVGITAAAAAMTADTTRPPSRKGGSESRFFFSIIYHFLSFSNFKLINFATSDYLYTVQLMDAPLINMYSTVSFIKNVGLPFRTNKL